MLVLLSLIFVNLNAKPLLCFKVFPTKVKYETVLPEYQHEPEIYRQLYLREKDREETRRHLQGYTRINAAEQALSHYLVYRTANLPASMPSANTIFTNLSRKLSAPTMTCKDNWANI